MTLTTNLSLGELGEAMAPKSVKVFLAETDRERKHKKSRDTVPGQSGQIYSKNFYIFAQIVPTPYLVISCVFFLGLFLPGKLLADLGAMASPSSPKDKFVVNVINPYLAEVRKHPQVLHVEDGVLRKEDLKGPVKEGSTEDRLKEME